MPRVSDLLDRLRPAGAPGPAGAVGVPADRRAAAEQELAPVFMALAAAVREAAEVGAAAADTAADVERRTTDQAAAMVAQARADAGAERAREAARILANARTELTRLAEQATAQADAVRHHAAERLPAAVDLIVAQVRAQVDEIAPARPTAPDHQTGAHRVPRPVDPVGAP